MNIHRARTDDDRATESSSGGTTVPEPERPATAPAAPASPAANPSARSAETEAPGVRTTKGGPVAADEIDRLSRRMERAVGGFVDDPRRAVREADAVLDEAARRLVRVLEERRSTLRGSWHGDNGAKTGTEELRVALTKYRDMTRELLNVG